MNAVYIGSLSINTCQLMKQIRSLIILQNSLEYDSSRDAYLKFQNEGNGAHSCEARLIGEKAILSTLFELQHLQ